VTILGGERESSIRLSFLEYGHRLACTRDKDFGSFKAAETQLSNLAVAAAAMVTALKPLNGAAQMALVFSGDEKKQGLWFEAGGLNLSQELNELAARMNLPVEVVAQVSPQGCLTWRYRVDEFSSLEKFCRTEARRLKKRHEDTNGLPSAARPIHGSPNMDLALSCAEAIMSSGGDLRKVNELAQIVAELVTGKKPAKRFAERECREARRRAQPPH
jgi:hypothetical protein